MEQQSHLDLDDTPQTASACGVLGMHSAFFRALCEPVRIDILAVLIRQGRSDVSSIAQHLPQDRSVISRHLQQLERASIVVARPEGRQVFYEVNAPSLIARFESILAEMRRLDPGCCTGSP